MSDLRILTCVDNPTLRETVEAVTHAQGLDGAVNLIALSSVSTTAEVLARIAADPPALILVQWDDPRWNVPHAVAALKTNPATRRIPIAAVSAAQHTEWVAQARSAGCDEALTRDELATALPAFIQQHTRHNVDESAELLRQAALLPSDLLIKGIHEFNAGAYFEQHETLETAWRAESGPIRQLYQGILQVGVAYYQIQRHNYNGALKMFQRAWQYLTPLPGVCQGVDVAQLRTDAQAARTELERLGPARIADFNPVLFKPVRLDSHKPA
jgi:predicted metal-dependent hydrolase